MTPRDREALEDIRSVIERALGFPIADFEALKRTDDLQDALIRCLEVMGEVTVHGTGQAETAHGGLIQLPVPYLSKNDSATGKGSRMCFASTCAMAAAFLKPDCLKGSGQLDNQFLALVQRYGDTTDASAQVAALQNLGLQARFRSDGGVEDLIQQLQCGIPCPVGWLHKGSATAPTGGGHWSLVIGWDPATRQLLMHDPNGEADLVNGGYVNTAIGSGNSLRYSQRNWGLRWQVEGPGTGWRIQINPML